jgi:hypothetical protein
MDETGNSGKTRALGGFETTFAGDENKPIPLLGDKQRLENAMFANGLRKILKIRFGELDARLLRIPIDLFQRHIENGVFAVGGGF